MVRGTTALKSRAKTTFFCLSNANIIFITTILKASPPYSPAPVPSSPLTIPL